MTCVEFKALAHAYALGSLDPEEREAAEAHLAAREIHEGCLEALAAADAAAELLILELPAERASEAIWDRIEQGVARQAGHEVARPPRWRAYLGGLALAAAVAAVALLLGHSAGQEAQRALDERTIAEAKTEAAAKAHADQTLAATTQAAQQSAQIDRCKRDLQAAQAQMDAQQKGMLLLGRPSTQLVAMAPSKGSPSVGTMIFNRKDGQAVLVASALTPEAGHDYELWVIRGKEKIPAGLLKIDPKGPTLALVDEKLLSGGVDVFAITLEPAGGSTTPRGSLVLAGAVKKG